MITFENGVLTIDTTLSVTDSQAITAFADTVRNGERERIIKLLEDNCECMFEINEYYSGCHNHRIIALIKGEKK